MRSQWGRLTLALSALGLVHVSLAAPIIRPADLPSTADPGRVSEPFLRARPTKVAPEIEPAPIRKRKISAAARKISFTLNDVQIDSNQAVDARALLPYYQKYIGKRVTFAELQDIAHAMTVHYRKQGYVLSQVIVPPQKVVNGRVRFKVIEGYISRVSITGRAITEGARDKLIKYGEEITKQRPLDMKTLERYALLANDLPGIDAKVVVLPAKDVSGAAELNFVVTQSRWDAYVGADNRGTKFLGRERVNAGVDWNGSFGSSGRTGLHTVVSGDLDELRFFAVTHHQPLNRYGTSLDLTFEYTETEPGGSLEESEVEGESTLITTKINHPLIRSREKNVNIFGGLRSTDSNTDIFGGRLYTDRIRSLYLGVTVEAADSYQGVNLLTAQVSQGLMILGATESGIRRSRSDGRADNTIFKGEASRLQRINTHFSALFAAEGQYAINPALSIEEYGYGGPRFGRGYDASEIVGDRGFAGKVELRFDSHTQGDYLDNWQIYGFYDGGKIWNINDRDQPSSQSGTSTGLGMRLFFNKYLYGDIEYGLPLTRDVAAEGNRDGRVFFTLVFSDAGTAPRT